MSLISQQLKTKICSLATPVVVRVNFPIVSATLTTTKTPVKSILVQVFEKDDKINI